jgi:(2R)-3-sulfolactate dehydrogenase (NADP+)
MIVKTAAELERLAALALERAGVSAGNAAAVARALVAAEVDGMPSHGLSRLPFYADQARSGKVDGRAEPALTSAGGTVRVDARCGFAYPAIEAGLQAGGALAGEVGVVAIAIANSHHFGVAGYHVERAAERGLVAIALGNTPAAIAPWGGRTPLFGTNPIAFATPRRQEPPLVIDMSLSVAARGKIMVANKKGEPIPAEWALDAGGKPTTDPAAALNGSMMPLGGAKGSAMALMVEILAAALTGSNYGYEASSFFTAEGPAPRVGQLFLLLNPTFFGNGGGFLDRVGEMLAQVAAQEGARLPGERRLLARERARQEGIAVAESIYRQLQEKAEA